MDTISYAFEMQKKINQIFTAEYIDKIITHCWENKKMIPELDIKNDFGIYIFYLIKEDKFKNFQELESAWKEGGIIKTPRAIKSNFSKCVLNNNIYIFYIGKSENLKKRVSEHITHHQRHSTYGLKLKDRKKIKKEDFLVGHWTLDLSSTISTEIKQFIITIVEQKIREKFKPLIGKK